MTTYIDSKWRNDVGILSKVLAICKGDQSVNKEIVMQNLEVFLDADLNKLFNE